MRDVAARASVGLKTVSRVYNDDPHVSPETRARVQQAMAELNYTPNTIATTFRSGRSNVIGVAVPDILDPFFTAIVHAVEIEANKRGFSVLITSLGTDPSREQAGVEDILQRNVAGMIVTPISNDQSYLRRWADRTPIVFVDRAPGRLSADHFIEDNLHGAIHAVDHLIGHGHRRIVFLGDSTDVQTSALRLDGYREALERAGIAADPRLIVLDQMSWESSAQEFTDLFASAVDAPTAVFCSNPRITLDAFVTLRTAQLRDISLVGFAYLPTASLLSPAITVIDQDPLGLGHEAITRILARLENPTRRYRRKTMLPVSLIERESCFAPRS